VTLLLSGEGVNMLLVQCIEMFLLCCVRQAILLVALSGLDNWKD
jgi:hypothetical protein